MTERDLERRARRRLAVLRHVEEVSFNVAATCRYYGISRQCYYRWLRRYEADGLDGLKERSSRPHNSPRVTQAEVIEKIVWLRKHSPISGALVTRSSSKGGSAPGQAPSHLASGAWTRPQLQMRHSPDK